jgi:hypothetical protein
VVVVGGLVSYPIHIEIKGAREGERKEKRNVLLPQCCATTTAVAIHAVHDSDCHLTRSI